MIPSLEAREEPLLGAEPLWEMALDQAWERLRVVKDLSVPDAKFLEQ
ncbi:MAG: hypothetical protein MRJ67_10455 [Nitrospirales bacterium]|nr:hypothetical protein [Nitrospirales bacterium]